MANRPAKRFVVWEKKHAIVLRGLKQQIRSLWDRVIFAQRLISILFIIVYFLYHSVLKSIP